MILMLMSITGNAVTHCQRLSVYGQAVTMSDALFWLTQNATCEPIDIPMAIKSVSNSEYTSLVVPATICVCDISIAASVIRRPGRTPSRDETTLGKKLMDGYK